MNPWGNLKNGAPVFNSNKEVVDFEEKMTYNKTLRQFVLTTDTITNELNVNLEIVRGSKENADVFLKEISTIVYAYIYKKKPAILRNKMEYYLTFDMRNRRILYLAMVDMVRYAFISGGNIIGYQPAVNLNESGMIDIEKLRDERIVSYVVDSLLKTNFLIDRNFVESFDAVDFEV